MESFNEQATKDRLEFLEQQAIGALKGAADKFEHPVFPCALIAGDVVILHLLHKAGLLDKGAFRFKYNVLLSHPRCCSSS